MHTYFTNKNLRVQAPEQVASASTHSPKSKGIQNKIKDVLYLHKFSTKLYPGFSACPSFKKTVIFDDNFENE